MLQPLCQSPGLQCQKALGPADAAGASGDMFSCPSRAASQGTASMARGCANNSCVCIQNLVLHIHPCLSQLSEAQLCSAVLTTDVLFQLPLLAHERTAEPGFHSATQALVSQLKHKWRTEQNSSVQHCPPQIVGISCLRPHLSAISIFCERYALAEWHTTPLIVAFQSCSSFVKAVAFSSTRALGHREGLCFSHSILPQQNCL